MDITGQRIAILNPLCILFRHSEIVFKILNWEKMYIIPYIDFKRVDQKYSGTWKGKLLVEEQYQSQNISLKSNCDCQSTHGFTFSLAFLRKKDGQYTSCCVEYPE